MTAKQLIYDLLSPLTEATLVWAYQGRHVPPRPYIAMYRMNNRSGQWDYESPVDVDGNVFRVAIPVFRLAVTTLIH